MARTPGGSILLERLRLGCTLFWGRCKPPVLSVVSIAPIPGVRSRDEEAGATLGKWVAGSSVEKKGAKKKKYCIL